jgi:hypothetical protein
MNGGNRTDSLAMAAEKTLFQSILSLLIQQNNGPIGTDLYTGSTTCAFFFINDYLFHDYVHRGSFLPFPNHQLCSTHCPAVGV